MIEEKSCTKCKRVLPIANFYADKNNVSTGLRAQCKSCCVQNCKEYRYRHHDTFYAHHRAYLYRTGRARPLDQCKDLPGYLGFCIAERALSKFFDHIKRMPFNNPGYDFVCDKGFKIDVKSGVLHKPKTSKNMYWDFHIKYNKTADYFLCIGFDNRESLTPLHVWLVPGNVINQKRSMHVANSEKILDKWSQYEQSLERVIACCDSMKQEQREQEHAI